MGCPLCGRVCICQQMSESVGLSPLYPAGWDSIWFDQAISDMSDLTGFRFVQESPYMRHFVWINFVKGSVRACLVMDGNHLLLAQVAQSAFDLFRRLDNLFCH